MDTDAAPDWPPDWADRPAPDLDTIEALALAAVAALPAHFRAPARAVRLVIEEYADEATLDDLGIEDAYDLTGLYEGVPLTERSVMDPPQGPDTIRLYRRAILDEWAERGDITLGDLVAHVMVHELAHHFGWSDDDIASIDRWWE